MIKIYGKPTTTFAEFPDEIALCLNISNCPGHCDHCSEPELLEDVGDVITPELIDKFIVENPGITTIGFMGGDSDHKAVAELTNYIHTHYDLKVGMYSGRDFLDLELASILDFYKIGRFIMPVGPEQDWYKQSCGPLVFPFSNQIYFERHGDKLVDCTNKFRKQPINELSRYII